MTKWIIVRHCQAEGNLKRFFQGKIDSDITQQGARQIAQVASLLSSEPIDVIYTTSKQRARKTAEGINLYHQVEIITDDRLVEIDAGDWEGVFLSDIEKRYPEQYGNWRNHPADFHAPGGESMQQVYDRVSKALDELVAQNRNRTVCLVSHGCAIKNMMCYLHGWPLSRIKEVPLGTNTSVNVVTFDEALHPSVLIENYTEHLQDSYNYRA